MTITREDELYAGKAADHSGNDRLGVAHWLDVHAEIDALCKRLGIDPSYVYRLDVEVDKVTVHAYKGEDGICKGRKHVDRETGEVAAEVIAFTIRS